MLAFTGGRRVRRTPNENDPAPPGSGGATHASHGAAREGCPRIDGEQATPAQKGATHASHGAAREGCPRIDGEQATPAQKEKTLSEVYRFGPFELQVDRHELLREGIPLRIEPKPLEVLAELVRHAGELVTKAELMESVWADRVVTESVIARCINKLRAALDDESQTLICTVHGYGYRFAGKVVCVPDESATAADGAAVAPPRAGDTPPLRPNWRLSQLLDERGAVWLAIHEKTGEKRVFKYGLEPHRVRSLRREISIHRLLQRGLGERGDIARLLDFNLQLLPYFLELEYCPQGNLSDWCASQGGVDRVALDIRLELMAQAAGALAAAHALGVLHMDIKPSNLLVWTGGDGRPRIRWSDFGSGRLLEPWRLSELGITHLGSTRTATSEVIALQGTLNYLAPELLRGETPTIRSDLYALGVVLYQIVAGDLRKPLAVGWEENVTDELLRSDIAASAHDNPGLRLASADELADRLRCLGERRLKLAEERRRQQESALLRQRLDRARARRPWLAAATLTLVAGTCVSLWEFLQAVRSRDEARAQAGIADAVVNFLDQDILSAGSPFSVSSNGGGRLSVREAVDRAAENLSGRFPHQPEVEASIRATIGQVYVEDGDYPAAEKQVRAAVQLARGTPGGVDERILRAEYGLVFTLSVEQKFSEAHELLEEANRELARRHEMSSVTALRRDVINGNYYFALQDYSAAAPWFEHALTEALQTNPTDVSQIAIRQTSLAWCYTATRRFDDAWRLYKQALTAVRSAEKDGGTLTGTVEERYGIGLFLAGHETDARAMLQSAHEQLKRAIGDDGLTAEALTYLGWLELREGHAAQAVPTLREAYRQEVASAGARHRMSLRALACLGLAEIASGQPDAGLADLGAAVTRYERELGAAAAETQLFAFLLLEHDVASGHVPDDAAQRIHDLTADRLTQAAPWEDWRPRLALLESRIGRMRAQAPEKTGR
jgi:eukaryotic-like serine/threonine-protein kinase